MPPCAAVRRLLCRAAAAGHDGQYQWPTYRQKTFFFSLLKRVFFKILWEEGKVQGLPFPWAFPGGNRVLFIVAVCVVWIIGLDLVAHCQSRSWLGVPTSGAGALLPLEACPSEQAALIAQGVLRQNLPAQCQGLGRSVFRLFVERVWVCEILVCSRGTGTAEMLLARGGWGEP